MRDSDARPFGDGKMRATMEGIWADWADAGAFSGVFSVSDESGVVFERACGQRNRSEGLPNHRDTAFGIASGTKLFTGLAVCTLLDEGRLSLTDRLSDILPHDLGQIDRRVTIHQLLTHTSGVGDYIDEDAPDCMERLQALYHRYPVYLWERLDYYLPMIAPLPPKFAPGERCAYSNAGYVLLGLAVEAAGGMPYQQYVLERVAAPCGLQRTGFYRADELPANTAHGYIRDERSGRWLSNVFGLPVIGGADGGIYTCAGDLDRLWRAVFDCRLFSEGMRDEFLKEQVRRDETRGYGLGVYRTGHDENTVYYAVGSDTGVDFFTAYFPRQRLVASALGNTELNTFPLLRAMLAAANE